MGGNPIHAIDPYGLYTYGLNLGLGVTFGIKGSYSFQILLDTEGNFAIQRTKEAGIGFGRSVGVFAKGVFGNVSNVYDLEQWGGSLSGSFGYFSSVVSDPLSTWGEGEYSVSKLDKCIGIDPTEVIQGPKLNG